MTYELPEPVAHMFSGDLVKFQSNETFAQAYSVAVGSPDGDSEPLFTAEQMHAAYAAGLAEGRKELINQPFERVPQHAYDPGFGPVPPEPKACPHGVDKKFAFNCPECNIPNLVTRSAVPDGWKLVPIEPTPEMIAAMAVEEATARRNEIPLIGMVGAECAYAAMLAAAPEPSHD